MKRRKLLVVGMLVCLSMSACSRHAVSEEDTATVTTVEEEADVSGTKADTQEEHQQEVQQNGITITYQNESQTFEAEDGVEIYRYEYSYPNIVMEGNDVATQEIAKDQERRKTEFVEACELNRQSAKETYDNVAEEEKESYEAYGDYGNYNFQREDDKVISFMRQTWSYNGGAHGDSYTTGVNYDCNTGKLLTLDDIFENKEEALKVIKNYILKQCEYPYYQERLFEDYEQSIDTLLAEDYWCLGKEGFRIISNEYVLGPYVAGEFEFVIPYQELTGLKEEYQPEGAYIYPVLQNASVEMDLDSDGNKENVCFSMQQNVSMVQDENGEESEVYETPNYTLTINDKDMTEQFMELTEFHAEDLNEYYYLVDLDESDDYIEIAICDYGANDYNTTDIVRYDNGKLEYVGYLQDMIAFETCKLEGDGTLQAKVHSTMVETVLIECNYVLVDGKLELKEEEWYLIDMSNRLEEYQSHAILKDVTVYTEKDITSQPKVLTPSDGKVSFPATDNKEWVQVKMQDGTIYYLHMAGTLQIDNAGTAMYGEEVFENLLIAG